MTRTWPRELDEVNNLIRSRPKTVAPAGLRHYAVPGNVPADLIPVGEELARLEESARWSSQTQFEAAKAWQRWNFRLGVPASVFGLFSGGAAFIDSFPPLGCRDRCPRRRRPGRPACLPLNNSLARKVPLVGSAGRVATGRSRRSPARNRSVNCGHASTAGRGGGESHRPRPAPPGEPVRVRRRQAGQRRRTCPSCPHRPRPRAPHSHQRVLAPVPRWRAGHFFATLSTPTRSQSQYR